MTAAEFGMSKKHTGYTTVGISLISFFQIAFESSQEKTALKVQVNQQVIHKL